MAETSQWRYEGKKVKMDLARALGCMGFNSSRWLDSSQNGSDPKTELDKALFNRMQDLMKKQREASKEEDKAIKKKTRGGSIKRKSSFKKPNGTVAPSLAEKKAKSNSEKLQDEIIMLHEAYQFLMKKYNLTEAKRRRLSRGDSKAKIGAVGAFNTKLSSSGQEESVELLNSVASADPFGGLGGSGSGSFGGSGDGGEGQSNNRRVTRGSSSKEPANIDNTMDVDMDGGDDSAFH